MMKHPGRIRISWNSNFLSSRLADKSELKEEAMSGTQAYVVVLVILAK